MQHESVITKDVALIGGGHSHIAVIRNFGMSPWPGVRLTVVSRDSFTPYSGMLPGMIAGHYAIDECHIDLQRLCSWAGARLFHASATNIDFDNRVIHCDNRPPVRFDLLSINTGSQPALNRIAGADRHGAALKPIDRFMARWLALLQQLRERREDLRICVVGGGAAGVEVCLGMQYRLQREAPACRVEFHIVTADSELLPTHNRRSQRFFRRLCAERGIAVTTGRAVTAASDNTVTLDDGSTLPSDFTVWALPAAPQSWLAGAGLECDDQGFVAVGETLESRSHPGVFAAGDNASLQPDAVAKSGVYAVRQGPVLAANLRRAAEGRPLQRYRPQRRFLSLISTGDRKALASRGSLAVAGAWVWRWKDWIDRRFIQRYSDLPAMTPDTDRAGEEDSTATVNAMRCGGCGAKVGSQVLERVLAELDMAPSPDAVGARDGAEDAAVLRLPPGRLWVQSVDYFRQFVDDPWLLGRIGANHCLGDIYAMGAAPHSALAICTVAFAGESIMEDNLRQMLTGALSALKEADTALIGGHSNEGAEMAFGLTVNGLADEDALLTKGGLRAGDRLILTKPLGTGTLLVANMQGIARAHWMDHALAQMQVSQRRAADILREAGATGCTDITGFGLLGHLLEMLRSAGLGATVALPSLPLLAGAEECLRRGLLSSLHPDNWRSRLAVINAPEMENDALFRILFDPQTAGGLLAGVASERVEETLIALRAAGYEAACIGSVDDAVPAGMVEVERGV